VFSTSGNANIFQNNQLYIFSTRTYARTHAHTHTRGVNLTVPILRNACDYVDNANAGDIITFKSHNSGCT